MNINSKHCYYSKSFQYFPKKLTYLNQSMCREALNSNSYVNNVYLYKIYIFILSINRICSTLMKRIFEQLNDYSECFFFLLGRGLSCCFPLSRSVTVKKINPLFIQPNNAMYRPLAKSRDRRYGSIVKIEDLQSGVFSSGFLQVTSMTRGNFSLISYPCRVSE